jgi:hypothetical protein
MSWPHLLMWAVVFGVGVPSAWRNPTSAALVVSWLAGEAYWLITGDNLPTGFYLFPDIFVLAVIFAKMEPCDYEPYEGAWHQFKCLLLDRSLADRVVMLIFPVMWAIYVAPVHPYYAWYMLWALVIIQFIAAGIEGFVKLSRGRKRKETPIIDFHMFVASNVIPFPARGADAADIHLLAASGGGSG